MIKKVDEIVLDENGKILWDKANILSGSPHAALIDNDLYVESKILRDELSKTSSFQNANITIIEK